MIISKVHWYSIGGTGRNIAYYYPQAYCCAVFRLVLHTVPREKQILFGEIIQMQIASRLYHFGRIVLGYTDYCLFH